MPSCVAGAFYFTRVPTEEELESSDWDPEPIDAAIAMERIVAERVPYKRRTEYETELLRQEIEGCRNLLFEVIRRAAFDWVLYRSSTRLLQRQLAQQAYEWLFVEEPGHPSWSLRIREDKVNMSFLAVCEQLDLDPETSRDHIRELTPKHVTSVGRPASYRTRAVTTTDGEEAYALPDGVVVEDAVDTDDTLF